jgi:hypothetical protein
MFRSLFANLTHAEPGFSGRALRRTAARAMSLAAITALVLGALPSPAVAQTPAGKPLRCILMRLTCEDESNDNTWPNPDHDEPYVLVFAADLRGPVARGTVFSRSYDDVDTNETRAVNLQFWSLDGSTGSPIASDNDYIFLAAMLEDDGNLSHVTRIVRNTLLGRLDAYRLSGLSRAAMTSRLIEDMDLVIESARRNSGDADDRIGGIFEIVWGANGLNAARAGHAVELFPRFVGSGSSYKLHFRLE